ncbi:MAG: nickel-dependent hydrogenase large subunit [Helicobacteraceae bacterium]|jgi:ech hydrogenase subunit E|nr:nickel-dependent hydrogenase large subunit [Helicobacteraceae bacterium]
MTETIEIPLGSQHIALLEPMHLTFSCENETVRSVKSDMGYVHRGVEYACQNRFDFKVVPTVVGRICGLCAITHSTAACLAIEKSMGIVVSDRAKWLRILALELDRVHSHLLCLAHTAESAGYEALFMKTMMRREAVMDAIEALTGNRVQFDYAAIGGVNKDLTPETARTIREKLAEIRSAVDEISDRFANNAVLRLRFVSHGTLSAERVRALGAVGLLARSAGVKTDVRIETDDLPYAALGFEPIMEQDGDIHARNTARLKEVLQSCDLIDRVIDSLPEGEIKVKVRGRPSQEAVARVEAPRGELFYLIKGSGTSILDRLRIRTPTYANLGVFLEIFVGEEYANVPPILASLDPCMSCTAR